MDYGAHLPLIDFEGVFQERWGRFDAAIRQLELFRERVIPLVHAYTPNGPRSRVTEVISARPP